MTDPRNVRRAVVRKGGVEAAELVRHPDHVAFAYLPDYDGPAVATTLPRDGAPVRTPPGALPAFFAGLLPEGRRLTALRTAVKTSADDELSLLLAVGTSTIGDVTVVPAGSDDAPAPPLVLPVARAELIHDRDGRPGLVVARFDRVQDGEHVRSLAVEDACQLLGRYPADKYAVTSEAVSRVVSDVCAARPVAARACLVQFALAWLTGNGDLHAKNVSVLQQPGGEWRVAPIYDIPSTLPYGDQTMALELDGRRDGLTRRRFRAYAATLGLPERATERALDEVLAATEPLLDDLAQGALPLNRNALQTLTRRLARRRRDLAD